MISFNGHNVGHPELLLGGLRKGDMRHGLHDGSWSLVDAIHVISHQTGPKTNVTLAVWTASTASLQSLSTMVADDRFASLRIMIDRSMPGRDPKACDTLLEEFGHDRVRVWCSHAKFVVFQGGKFDVLLLTSANLASNRNIENWTAFVDEQMVGEYLLMAERLWERQSGQVGFDQPSRARHDTAAVIGPPQTAPQVYDESPDKAPDPVIRLVR